MRKLVPPKKLRAISNESDGARQTLASIRLSPRVGYSMRGASSAPE